MAGLRTCRRALRGRPPTRMGDAVDRSNTKTTLMATVCDSRDLQPYLPQIVLARYTQNARPPAHLLAACRDTGEPLEYWHGTGGFATSAIIKLWATRMRSVVHSFNPDAWILLVWDCSQTHLNLEVARHMRRLGILVILVPAKLTWLLQVCDVCVFKELKTRIRIAKSALRCEDPAGRLRVGDWISACGSSIRDVIVDRDHEEGFERMGLGESVESIRGRVRRAVDPADVRPRLPARADFARMVNRQANTDAFRALHAIVVGHFITVHALPAGAVPPRGAIVPLPDVAPALSRFRMTEHEDLAWEDALEREVEQMAADRRPRDHGRRVALNRTIRGVEPDV